MAPSRRLQPTTQVVRPESGALPARPGRGRAVLSALRVHHWLKNLLIFVPVLLDHRILDLPLILRTVVAFFAFSFAASGVYVLNDLLDMEADQQHPTKKGRPFAAGHLSTGTGLLMLPLLIGAAVGLSVVALPRRFLLILGLYLAITTAYSFHLKRLPVLDVLILAGLYTLRVLAGIAATEVRFSTWLLAFCMFLFLSLAFLKRFSELIGGRRGDRELLARRGYMGGDLQWLGSMGGASGYMSVLVFALYISSDEVRMLYGKPELLWLICPLLLYWVGRMWLRANRGQIRDDPVVEAVRDRYSYVVALIVGGVMLAAL